MNKEVKNRIFNIIGIVLCVILVPILIVNVTLIIKGFVSDDVPTLGGWYPMIVLSDSMEPEFYKGDLIIGKTIDASEVKVGDVISFFDPESRENSVLTHRVIEVYEEEGNLFFRTQGDKYYTPDNLPVPASSLIGIYKTSLSGVGSVAMFMQKPIGFIVCVFVPLILLVVYDLVRRKIYDTNNKQDTEALLAELAALKAEKAKASQNEESNNTSSPEDADK